MVLFAKVVARGLLLAASGFPFPRSLFVPVDAAPLPRPSAGPSRSTTSSSGPQPVAPSLLPPAAKNTTTSVVPPATGGGALAFLVSQAVDELLRSLMLPGAALRKLRNAAEEALDLLQRAAPLLSEWEVRAALRIAGQLGHDEKAEEGAAAAPADPVDEVIMNFLNGTRRRGSRRKSSSKSGEWSADMPSAISLLAREIYEPVLKLDLWKVRNWVVTEEALHQFAEQALRSFREGMAEEGVHTKGGSGGGPAGGIPFLDPDGVGRAVSDLVAAFAKERLSLKVWVDEVLLGTLWDQIDNCPDMRGRVAAARGRRGALKSWLEVGAVVASEEVDVGEACRGAVVGGQTPTVDSDNENRLKLAKELSEKWPVLIATLRERCGLLEEALRDFVDRSGAEEAEAGGARADIAVIYRQLNLGKLKKIFEGMVLSTVTPQEVRDRLLSIRAALQKAGAAKNNIRNSSFAGQFAHLGAAGFELFFKAAKDLNWQNDARYVFSFARQHSHNAM